MKRILFGIFFFLISFVALAQLPAGELRASLASAKTDSAKIALYKELISYYSPSNPDSANFYSNEALRYAADKKYDIGAGAILEHMSAIDRAQGRVDLADKRIKHALDVYRKIDYLQGIAGVYNSMGAIESIRGDYDTAVKLFISALKLHEKFTDDHSLMLTYLNLGSLYLQHNDEPNADKYLDLARRVGAKMPLTDATISVYNTLGIAAIAKGDTQTGLKIFLNDLALSDKPEFVMSRIECLNYLGRFYLDKGMFDTALYYLNQGLGIAREKNLLELRANISFDIGQVLSDRDPIAALRYLDSAREIGMSMRDRSFLVTVYEQTATVYKRLGKYKEALDATEHKQRIADSIFNINKTMEIAGMGYEYDAEKTNLNITRLEELNRKSAEERNILIGVAISVMVILLILFFYYRKSIALNKQLRSRKEDLKTLNTMKDKLFSVIGHDLRTPLATIPAILDIYEHEDTGEEDREFIFSNLKEHAKVSLETLDKLLYWGQSLVKGNSIRKMDFDSKGFIIETIEFKRMAAMDKSITVTDTTAADIRLHADPTHFDFIVRNLLANAIKYTRDAGRITISADNKSMDGFVVFSVKDNGIGMDKATISHLFSPINSMEGTANEKGNGIGLSLCKEFAVQNGGDIWVESEQEKGSTFYFSVKRA